MSDETGGAQPGRETPAAPPAPAPQIDVQRLAELVYRLMQAEARQARRLGETPSGRRRG